MNSGELVLSGTDTPDQIKLTGKRTIRRRKSTAQTEEIHLD